MSEHPALPDSAGLSFVGYRGTGKSTIGRLTAQALGRSFVDADLALETRLGRSIRAIFREDGEPAFRDWEEGMLLELTAEPARRVLATGGGVVLREANRAALKRFGPVVWLRSRPAVLARRLGASSHRPALTSAGIIEEIADVLAARDPLYRAVADLEIETDGMTTEQVVRELLAALGVSDVRARRGG